MVNRGVVQIVDPTRGGRTHKQTRLYLCRSSAFRGPPRNLVRPADVRVGAAHVRRGRDGVRRVAGQRALRVTDVVDEPDLDRHLSVLPASASVRV